MNLRPQDPRLVFPAATFAHCELSLFWRDGKPEYQVNPPQDVGRPEHLVARLLDERGGELSRKRRRFVRRWLKDCRA